MFVIVLSVSQKVRKKYLQFFFTKGAGHGKEWDLVNVSAAEDWALVAYFGTVPHNSRDPCLPDNFASSFLDPADFHR